MIQVRDATRPEVWPALLRAIDGPYPIDAVLGEKLREGYRGAPAFLLAEAEGRGVGAAVLCGEYVRLIAVDRELRRRGIGSALLAGAEDKIAPAFDRVVIAAEPGNYFTPGVLKSEAEFFLKRGYEVSADAVNLLAPAKAYPETRAGRAAKEDRNRVLDFVESNFGRIWRFETARAFEHDSPSVVIIGEEGGILGFNAWCANNAALGSYGPAGVAGPHRGTGVGRELLHAALTQMHADGISEALIQWAAALGFYERYAGASLAHRFLVLEKHFRV